MTRSGTELPVVTEDEGRTAGDHAVGFQDIQVDVEGDLAEGDDHLQVGQQFQLALEVGTAVAQFLWRGFVAGRGAMGGGGDVEIVQGQAVVAGNAGGAGGETGLVEDPVEDVAGAVAGEHATRSVGTVSARRESQNQDTGGRVAEGRHGESPVGLVAVGAALELRDFRRMPAQAGTTSAGYYLLVKNFQQI